jgi:LAO/AO transport system kinase
MIISIENDKKKTARSEKAGIQPEIFWLSVKHSKYRKNNLPLRNLFMLILLGNITALNRAITLVESTNTTH